MKIIAIISLALLSFALHAGPVGVRGARIATSPELTRLVLDTTAPLTQHKIFALDNPARLVIDLFDTRIEGKLPQAGAADYYLTRIRSGMINEANTRIVLDLKQPIRAKSFLLPPQGEHGHRLVIDLLARDGAAMPAPRAAPPSVPVAAEVPRVANLTETPAATPTRGFWSREAKPRNNKLRDVVVAIDAGHGGKDPGAVGPGGNYEKTVTLAIARKLAALVAREPGMRPLMVRDGDAFIPLRERFRIARRQHADLFLSIHADASQDPDARGSSVFVLSERGATSEAAKWLAARENQADLVGGVALVKNEEVAGVLMEMTQNLTMEHSTIVAQHFLSHMSDLGPLHQTRVQAAGFAVLKAPDIPSVLVETAFISNPSEEQRLIDERFQARVAAALLAGIKAYFSEYPPPQTLLAQR